MKKLFSWVSDNILYVYTLFLLAFIPLYPKIPLFDIKHTWVYIRVDDIAIAIGVLLFFIQLLRRKVTIKIPLMVPIVVYWIIGAISTIYAIFFIFPHIDSGFTSLGILYYLRHIEYLCVFFIAYNSVRTKGQLKGVIAVIVLTLIAVVLYGFGQRYFGFHAYLTMNEEFAKGIPLQLSALARIPSTFAGHYDLAAYLVLVIAIVGAMISAFKNWGVKILLLLSGMGGLFLLLMTASRVSFAVYLVTIIFLLIIQKKKLFIIPVVILSILLANSFEGMSQRFASTISQADVIVDARTGETIGIGREVTGADGKKSIVVEDIQSTGENLPQGSQYINVPQRGDRTEGEITYKRSTILDGSQHDEVSTLQGEFVVKKVLAYDISFTTRLGGTWPRAVDAFQRNIVLGSGYSSIDLASDNNYLRILGETGLLGFLSFVGIFVVYGIYVYRLVGQVKSPVSRNFALGVTAGIFGLALNAVLIDVFEASKVAYVLWMLVGLSLAFLHLEKKKSVNILEDLKKLLISTPAVIIYIIIGSLLVFRNTLGNYFIGDDFTWLRWAADCSLYSGVSGGDCLSPLQTFTHYFTNAEGFFYRPGTKVYFYSMYALFWLVPVMYHLVLIFLHAFIVSLIYMIGNRLLKSKLFAGILAFAFLVTSAHFEAVFWISVTGHLIAIASVLLGILLFSYYKDSKNILFLLFSILSLAIAPFFHEYGVVGPVLVIAYALINSADTVKSNVRKLWIAFIPMHLIIPAYLYLRVQSGSVGLQGDYNYNFIKLPVNAAGNVLGYTMYSIFGVRSLPWYDNLRQLLREDLLTAIVLAGVIGVIAVAGLVVLLRKVSSRTRRLVIFALVFFVVSMAPFLGLGNIAPRYIYFGSFGLILLGVLLLRYAYSKVQSFNPVVAKIGLGVFVIIYAGFHILELERIHADWQKASDITRTTVEELTVYYSINGKNFGDTPTYYVVNVPTRYGYAWVFPVGFEDAIWFTAQNENLKLYTTQDVEEAIDFREQNERVQLFIYDSEGNIERIIQEVHE